MRSTRFHCLIILATFTALSGCGRHGTDPHDDEPNPGRAERHEDGDEHGEDLIRLTSAQLDEAGVVIAPLAGGTIATHLTLPAEIGFNTDNLVHVTPRVPGIVAEVHAFIGDEVVQGQLLGVIDSPDLGQAKIDYLSALQALSEAQADVDRQRIISTNTEALLAVLKAEPSLEALQAEAAELRIGENKGRLISAYAKLQSARANYQREQTLRTQNLSTQADLLAAQEAYNSAIAEYLAVYEDIDFRYHTDLMQAQRAFRVAESAVSNADRRLHLLGLRQDQIDSIQTEPDTAISRYELHAPIAGRIIAKHLSIGEKVEEEPTYSIADLSTVWLNISVYAKYLDQIREGQQISVTAGDRHAAGTISYVSSALLEATRTGIARMVLDNRERRWRPGEFVMVHIETARMAVDRAVPVEAIQIYEGAQVVFVQDERGIRPHPVQIGRRNDELAELLDGPPVGARIVVKNSFLMKAELGKSAAGHGH
ncbi:MAG: efflux RND transporter periplasmic adaptor subunit [Planctomycetota bacterium]|nr:efflux RND transporter periplasmic adaptor subunit [Planctomycetota bacterium]